MSDFIGFATLTVCAFVPLWTARAVLTLAVAIMARADVRRRDLQLRP